MSMQALYSPAVGEASLFGSSQPSFSQLPSQHQQRPEHEQQSFNHVYTPSVSSQPGGMAAAGGTTTMATASSERQPGWATNSWTQLQAHPFPVSTSNGNNGSQHRRLPRRVQRSSPGHSPLNGMSLLHCTGEELNHQSPQCSPCHCDPQSVLGGGGGGVSKSTSRSPYGCGGSVGHLDGTSPLSGDELTAVIEEESDEQLMTLPWRCADELGAEHHHHTPSGTHHGGLFHLSQQQDGNPQQQQWTTPAAPLSPPPPAVRAPSLPLSVSQLQHCSQGQGSQAVHNSQAVVTQCEEDDDDDECFIRSSTDYSPTMSYDRLLEDEDEEDDEPLFALPNAGSGTPGSLSSPVFPSVPFQARCPQLTCEAAKSAKDLLLATDTVFVPADSPTITPATFPLSCVPLELNRATASSIGRRSRQEDSFALLDIHQEGVAPTLFAGVFDGHGGSIASQYVSSALHEHLVSASSFAADVPAALVAAFRHVDAALKESRLCDSRCCGTTAVTVCIRGREITIGNLGDSRAVMSVRGHGISLTADHKPATPSETSRVLASGGTIEFHRVAGELDVSRALGDFHYKCPDLSKHELCPVSNLADVTCCTWTEDCDFMILASDGLWDVMTPQSVVDFVSHHMEKEKKEEEQQQLTNASSSRVGSPNQKGASSVFSQPTARQQLTYQGGGTQDSPSGTANFGGNSFTGSVLSSEHVSLAGSLNTGFGNPVLSEPLSPLAVPPLWPSNSQEGVGSFSAFPSAACRSQHPDARTGSSSPCVGSGDCRCGTPPGPSTPRDALRLAINALVHHAVHTLNSNDNTTVVALMKS